MPDIIPTLRLNAIDFKPMAFQPIQYQAAQPDQQLMPRSLQVQEARTEKARGNIDAIDTAFSQLRNALDVSEHEWLDKRATEIREKLNEQVALGNTETAIRVAFQEAQNLKTDRELADKVSVNAKRQQAIQRIDTNNRLSDASKRRFKKVNEYSYKGNSEWEPIWNPTTEYTPQNIIDIAAQHTAADSGGHTTNKSVETLLDKEGKVTEDTSLAVASQSKTSTGRSNSFSKKLKEDMEQTMNDMLLQPEYYQGLKQYYESQLWDYYDNMNKAENATSESERQRYSRNADNISKTLADENGFIAGYSEEKGADEEDFTKWIQRTITPMYKNMEYYNKQTGESDSTDFTNGLFGLNVARQQGQDYSVTEKVGTSGKESKVTYIQTPEDWYNESMKTLGIAKQSLK